MEEDVKKGECCCEKPENIEVIATTNPGAYIKRCLVCGKNHYYMRIEPAQIRMRTK